MEKEKGLTSLSEVGEFGLIKQLTSGIKLKQKNSIKGVGDDAAVLGGGSSQKVLTTDMLLEGVHFDLAYTPLKHLGYKAVVVNLSDVYAMNACPEQITVSIAASSKFTLEAMEELYKGIHLACEIYGVDLVGGDTTSSKSGLVVSITALGSVPGKKVVFRDTAKKGNLIAVTGDLGAAYLGLQILEREKYVFQENPEVQPLLEGYDYLLERQLKPEARKDVIEWLSKNKIQPTAMIDISDGLTAELQHLCEQSKLGCEIYQDKLPIHPLTEKTAAQFNLDPADCALTGGEDYELLFTVKLEDYEQLKCQESIHIIGHMTADASQKDLITKDGAVVTLEAAGWNAFSDE